MRLNMGPELVEGEKSSFPNANIFASEEIERERGLRRIPATS